MTQTGNICEQCGQKVEEAYECNRCGMIVCPDCLKKTRNRIPPCNCVWNECPGWLEPVVNTKAPIT